MRLVGFARESACLMAALRAVRELGLRRWCPTVEIKSSFIAPAKLGNAGARRASSGRASRWPLWRPGYGEPMTSWPYTRPPLSASRA